MRTEACWCRQESGHSQGKNFPSLNFILHPTVSHAVIITYLHQELASQQALSQRLQASSLPLGRGCTRSTTQSEVQEYEQDGGANGDDDTYIPTESALLLFSFRLCLSSPSNPQNASSRNLLSSIQTSLVTAQSKLSSTRADLSTAHSELSTASAMVTSTKLPVLNLTIQITSLQAVHKQDGETIEKLKGVFKKMKKGQEDAYSSSMPRLRLTTHS